MKACHLSDEARAAVNAAVGAAKKSPGMTRAEEVQALMAKGMKIVAARQQYVWAFAPRKIAEAFGAPLVSAFPAASDLSDYMALGGHIVTTRA
jgi:hypothetical protein